MPELNPMQFDNQKRLESFRTAKSRPGTEVFFGNPRGKYVPNPLAEHLPEPVKEDHGDGSYTMRSTHGIPGYNPYSSVQRPRRVEHLPLDRLESTQGEIDRTHVHGMDRRKGEAPPIEVTHHTGVDRYVIDEGNHRAMMAIKRGQTTIPAYVTRVTPPQT